MFSDTGFFACTTERGCAVIAGNTHGLSVLFKEFSEREDLFVAMLASKTILVPSFSEGSEPKCRHIRTHQTIASSTSLIFDVSHSSRE